MVGFDGLECLGRVAHDNVAKMDPAHDVSLDAVRKLEPMTSQKLIKNKCDNLCAKLWMITTHHLGDEHIHLSWVWGDLMGFERPLVEVHVTLCVWVLDEVLDDVVREVDRRPIGDGFALEFLTRSDVAGIENE